MRKVFLARTEKELLTIFTLLDKRGYVWGSGSKLTDIKGPTGWFLSDLRKNSYAYVVFYVNEKRVYYSYEEEECFSYEKMMQMINLL